MGIYYVLLGVILVLGYLLCEKSDSKRNKIIYLAVVFLFLWCMATFRKGIGFDYQTYINIFKEIGELQGIAVINGTRFEIGFTLLTKLMTMFISSPVVMHGVYNVIILLPIAYFIYRYSDSVWISSWLYITLAFFYTNMNFIRQSIACSICALAFHFFVSEERVDIKLPFIDKLLGKHKKDSGDVFTIRPFKHAIPFLLMALLAISFHKTAIIIIPIYIIAHIKLSPITLSAYGIIVFTLYVLSDRILELIMDNTVFDYYRDTDYITRYLGGNFLLVPITVLILCVAVFYWWKDIDPNAAVLLNVVIVNATIWFVGSTKHMILERFSMYTYIYTLIIVPSALKALLVKPSEVLEHDELAADIKRRGNVPKSVTAKLKTLETKIDDHKKYYYSAVVAILLITFIYNYFGMYVNGFHKVFPYQSIFTK